MIAPRWYQLDSVAAAYRHLGEKTTNPCIELPTGAGKSLVIAMMASDVARAGGRALVVVPAKELVQQDRDAIKQHDPTVDVGINCAGLRCRDYTAAVIVGSIGSIFRHGCKFGRIDLLLIDEAHLIRSTDDGMYRQLVRDVKATNPNVKIVGLTATPYRTTSGMICTPDGVLNEICFSVSVKELIAQGFLCPLRSKGTNIQLDYDAVPMRGGEFVAHDAENLMAQEEIVAAACKELVEKTTECKSILVFAAGVKHAKMILAELQTVHGWGPQLVVNETPAAERDASVEAFRTGALRCLINVGCFTTGFDVRRVDCVAAMRMIGSPGLWVQIVGRGLRKDPSKEYTLILDFGGNIERHGPVDQIKPKAKRNSSGSGEAPMKKCPQCDEMILAVLRQCSCCGFEFPALVAKHEATASDLPIISEPATLTERRVDHIYYRAHNKKDAAGDVVSTTLCVEYHCGINQFREWVCVEHRGFARKKAERWWRERCSIPSPATVEEALAIAHGGGLAMSLTITLKETPGVKWPEIVGHMIGEIPTVPDASEVVQDMIELEF